MRDGLRFQVAGVLAERGLGRVEVDRPGAALDSHAPHGVGSLVDLALRSALHVQALDDVVAVALLVHVRDQQHVLAQAVQLLQPGHELGLERAVALQRQRAAAAGLRVAADDVRGEHVQRPAGGVDDHRPVGLEVVGGQVGDIVPALDAHAVATVGRTVRAAVEVQQQRGVCREGQRGLAGAGLAVDADVESFDLDRFGGLDDAQCHGFPLAVEIRIRRGR
jgi:hypothetical protein